MDTEPTESRSSFALWFAIAGALVCAGLLAGGVWYAFHPGNQPQPNPLPENERLQVMWKAPDFEFTNQHGKQVTNKDLAGRVWIADFFFTQCTTACPVLTSKLMLVQRQIENPDVRFVSFSVDPEHDTIDALHAYAHEWAPEEQRWILLRTQPDTLKALAQKMHVLVEKDDDPNNPILHSSSFFLVDGSGDVRGVYHSDDDEDLAQLVTDTNTLAESNGVRAVVADDASGEHIYKTLGCRSCHENNKVAPHLGGIAGRMVMFNRGKMTSADDAYLRESITSPADKIVDGFLPLMPGYRPYLSDAQLGRLVEYLHTLKPAEQPAETAKIAIDPICQMKVRVVADTPSSEYKGKTYYFCSKHCKEEFDADPDLYAED
ncbi:MAG: SCO family protein [Planctomycetes bacterium]|nr:SCO family protein [Planctomycetota bacterium]